MPWLIFILHLFIGSTFAGVGVIATLVMGYGTPLPILISAGGGFLLAFPASALIARALR